MIPQDKDIDSWATSGYEYAAGRSSVPVLRCQLAVDAFNAGVTNHNTRHDTKVPKITEGMKSTHSGSQGRADKELAILGPW